MNLAGRIGWILVGLLAAASRSEPQELVSPSTARGRAWIERFERDWAAADSEPKLACSVRTLRPVVNFALRYQAGYEASIPVDQFPPTATMLTVRFRVHSAETNASHYFRRAGAIPAGLRRRSDRASFGGGFLVGEGDYRVDWLLTEPSGRACRKSWEVRLRFGRGEQQLSQLLERGQVAPLALAGWKRAPAEGERPYQVALFLHVSPIHPRSVRLSQFDQSLLLTTLVSLLEKTPFRESSFHAISLHRQEELLRSGELDGAALDELRGIMDDLELATIGIDQLRTPEGAASLLADLLNEQINAPDAPDAVIFIGPATRETAGFPRGLLESQAGSAPLFFYLQLNYFPRWFPFADTIEKLTRRQGGKVFRIHDPRQFARALREIEELLAGREEPLSR